MPTKNEFWDRADGLQASQLDPSQYHDPAQDTLALGQRSVASALPPAIGGARGVIVPRATEGGAPPGFIAGAPAKRMNVDPDIPGESFVVDLTAMTKVAGEAATTEAGIKDAVSVEDRRYRASQALRTFAVSNKPDMPLDSAPAPRESPIPLPGVYVTPEADEGGGQIPMPAQQPQPIQPAIQAPQIMRPTIPNFSEQPPTTVTTYASVTPPQPIPTAPPPSLFATVAKTAARRPAPAAAQPVGSNNAPTFKISFEVKGSPVNIEAWYHDVIVEEHILVVCFDKTCVGYPRMTLRPTDEDLAIHIDGSDVFYIAQDPSIKFPYHNDELQLFFIKEEHPMTAPVAAEDTGEYALNAMTLPR
jgi:hypothetical protein